MRTNIVAGNWKMNMDKEGTKTLLIRFGCKATADLNAGYGGSDICQPRVGCKPTQRFTRGSRGTKHAL